MKLNDDTSSDAEMWGECDEELDPAEMAEIDRQIELASPRKSGSPMKLPTPRSPSNSPTRGGTPATRRPVLIYEERGVTTDRVSCHSSATKRLKPIKISKSHTVDASILSSSKRTSSPTKMDQDEMQNEETEVANMVDTDTESAGPSSGPSSLGFTNSRDTPMTSMESMPSATSQTAGASPRKANGLYPTLNNLQETRARSVQDYPKTLRLPANKRRTAPVPQDQGHTSPSSGKRSRTAPSLGDWREEDLLPFVLPKTPTVSNKEHVPAADVFGMRTPNAPGRTRSEIVRSPSPLKARTITSVPTTGSSTPNQFVQGSSRDGQGTRIPPPMERAHTTGHISTAVPPKQDAVHPSLNLEPIIDSVFGGKKLDLPFSIIAHSQTHQWELEKLSWGVQYELARGVTCGQWTWKDVTSHKLRQLYGSNVESAYKVAAVMRDLPVPDKKLSGVSIWREMDREQSAILENRGRGLGLMGEYDEQPNWYGGKIQQVVRLRLAEQGEKSDPPYVISLDKLEMRRSNRFARFLGSRRLLALHVPDKLLRDKGDDIRMFLRRKFVLLGRTYVPLHAKDEKLYMVETSEDYQRNANPRHGDNARLSLDELIKWYNPLAFNCKQPISKWTTRFALGFSTSVPVLQFEPQHIHFIDDQYASGMDKATAATEQIMTDGCGFMNAAALLAIKTQTGYNNAPTAVQGRVAGSKGLWILHPDAKYRKPEGPPEIWIRASQKKISLSSQPTDIFKVDRAHLIFDLVCPNRFLHPARLSMQTVLNLHHNRVPTDVFKTLMADSLRESVEKLTKWDGPYSTLLLIDAIDKAGRVSGTKLQRLAGGMSRALGISGREHRQFIEEEEAFGSFADEDDKDSPDDDLPFDPYTPPPGVHETAVELLKSGFQPLKSAYLFSKIRDIVTQKIDATIRGYHITIPQSVELTFEHHDKDPLGVLNEGEVYLRSSQGFEDMFTDMLEGPVLLSRNPTRVASDVQRVTAVRRPELAEYSNVLVVSTKGKRSQASYLAGGDYDGDTVMVVWDPNVVNSFQNAPLSVPDTDFVSKNFNRDIEKVQDFLARSDRISHSEAHSELLRVLLQGMADRKVGIYSMYHDIAVHVYGLSDPATERLAHMFTHLLDSDKTGLRAKDEVMKMDGKKFSMAMPECMKKDAVEENEQYGHKPPSRRPTQLGLCILCELMDAGKHEREKLLTKYDKLKGVLRDNDDDVIGPWEDANRRAASNAAGAPLLKADVAVVKLHVDKVIAEWKGVSWGSFQKKKSGKGNGAADTKRKDAIVKEITAKYHDPLPDISIITSASEVARWKAGYALKTLPQFAFRVAFWDICGMKAEAKGRSTSTGAIAGLSNIPSSVLRVLQPTDDS